jgi:DNA-binding transcriptional MerR regulator/effector-binding domain-containing protein
MNMKPSLTIGDFARATHLSIKTLRYYHKAGLLEPAEIDLQSGYRRYLTEQISTAQVIRRFRGLDMPVQEIRAVLSAPDLSTRNDLIAAHLTRLEEDLARTQSAVASLRELLQPPSPAASIEYRSIAETTAVAISEVIDVKDALLWFHGALAELYATLAAHKVPATAPAGGIFADSLFSRERGQATLFIPCDRQVRLMGRVKPLVVPAVELAVTVHNGPHDGIDRAYGALATHVTQHALAVAGPIREYYFVSPHDTSDETVWRTEIGWPIFQTGSVATNRPFSHK